MSPERHPRRRRRILIGIAALIVVLVGAGAVFALTRGGDVNNPDVEFHAEPTQTPVPESTPEPKKKGKRVDPLAKFGVGTLDTMADVVWSDGGDCAGGSNHVRREF